MSSPLRDLILGTAGHIDHGKTALVKALTGIDCDRLPEEKKRGITIDIGFAHLDLGDFHLGIVDVPGHERFIKNMLAGATSIDLALLVVSAGESIKPQTREHLEILQLLGLRHGVIALTKADLVDETTREVVALEIRDLVKGTFLESAPLIATSALTGMGIAELKQALREQCEEPLPRPLPETERGENPPFVAPPRFGEELVMGLPADVAPPRFGEGLGRGVPSEWFRLAIDRSFIVQGHGTIVTGSVTSGSLRVGDEVEWLPRGERVRVRALHNHDTPVEEVHCGQRAAINLAGIPHEEVTRGQEIATPGYLVSSKVLTVRLHALAENRRPLKHRTPARLHIGTAEVMATLSLLDCDAIEPDGWGLAQLFLDEPVMATWGQPFVLRDSSAEHTLGGGQVLQPTPIKIRRRHIEILERVEKIWTGDAALRAEVVAWFGGWQGFTTADIVRGAGIGPEQAIEIVERLHAEGKLAEVLSSGRKVLLHRDRLAEVEDRILTVLAKMHEESPLLTTHDRQKVLSLLEYIGDDGILQGVVDRLIQMKKLVGDTRRIARADFKPKLSANQRKLKDKIVEAHLAAAFQPPDAASFVGQAAGNAIALKDIYEVAIAEGLLVRVTSEIYLHADIEAEMRKRVADKLQEQATGLTVGDIRDLLQTSRKFAVPLCEYLDRIGATRREGDLRVKG